MFAEKFSLLNSQEHSEEIHWSPSSSDYENTTYDHKTSINKSIQPRKRKRRKKVTKNTPNLDVKISTVSRNKSVKQDKKSPILLSKRVCKSPILLSRRSPSTNAMISPVISKSSLHLKSPILTVKFSSPMAGKARKQLFNERTDNNSVRKSVKICSHCDIDSKEAKTKFNMSEISTHVPNQDFQAANALYIEVPESRDGSVISESVNVTGGKDKLINKFLEDNFSSDNTSQHISDTPTPNDSTKSDEIDILSCKTQSVLSNCEIKQEIVEADSINNSSKKVKYKKGGLAYRLNVLLKKHNANVCLWQHERFLARNSNFIIPKGEHSVFHVHKATFKYDNYLLEVCDVHNIKYIILINNFYVTCNISGNSVIKLYQPLKILDFNQYYKLIINVCKFEVVEIKIND